MGKTVRTYDGKVVHDVYPLKGTAQKAEYVVIVYAGSPPRRKEIVLAATYAAGRRIVAVLARR